MSDRNASRGRNHPSNMLIRLIPHLDPKGQVARDVPASDGWGRRSRVRRGGARVAPDASHGLSAPDGKLHARVSDARQLHSRLPDAAPAVPDALGDTLRAVPDAAPAVPDAAPAVPDATGDTLRALPDAAPAVPDATGDTLRALPDALRDTLPALPDAAPALPDATGDTLRALPDAAPAVPDSGLHACCLYHTFGDVLLPCPPAPDAVPGVPRGGRPAAAGIGELDR